MNKIPPAEKHRMIKILVTFCTVILMGAVLFIIPLRPTVSETEKRELAKFPEFSISSLMSGEYFSGISTWFSDTVPFRDSIMGINSVMQKFLGTSGTLKGFNEGAEGDEIPDAAVPDAEETLEYIEKPSDEAPSVPVETTYPEDKEDAKHVEQMGSIVVVDNAAFEYYNFVRSTADNYRKALNTAAARFPGYTVYATVAPTSTDITLNQKVRKNLNVSDQKEAINYMLGSTSEAVKQFNCFDNIMQHRDEYVYFRTDHHWTALAAYYAYEVFCNTKGITPIPLSAYEKVSFDGFLGTFYNDSGKDPALAATPDVVDAYKPPCNYSMTITDRNDNTTDMPLIYDESSAPASLKYGTFICGDNPLSTIRNHDMTEGESCVVIKESYGNAFVPFLVGHYKTIYVIDYRHYSGTLAGFLSSHEVDDIIFCNNISMTRNSDLVQDFTNFIVG